MSVTPALTLKDLILFVSFKFTPCHGFKRVLEISLKGLQLFRAETPAPEYTHAADMLPSPSPTSLALKDRNMDPEYQ